MAAVPAVTISRRQGTSRGPAFKSGGRAPRHPHTMAMASATMAQRRFVVKSILAQCQRTASFAMEGDAPPCAFAS